MRIRSTRQYHLPLALLLLAGCNSDPLNGPGPSGSGTVSGLQITDSQDQSVRAWRSPARVSFTLATQDPGGSADVTLTFSRDGGVTFQPVTTGEDDVLINLPSGDHDVSWLFAAPTDLGTDRYRGGVIVRAEVTNGNTEQRTVELGNDVPVVISVETPSADVKGDADVNFTVADVAGDRLSLRVEFNQDAEGEFPTDSWQLARPVGVDPTSDTPDFAITDIEPPFGGSALAGTFTWASAFDPAGDPAVSEQVASLDGDVKLRFTAVDEFGVESAMVETGAFLVDNNEPPSLSLDGDFLVNGIKDRGNIPLSFTVTDEDSDEVQIAVQWKTATGSFPLVRNGSGHEVELGSLTPSELRDLLENPARRQDRLDGQIAMEDPLVYEGQLGTIDGLESNQARLPELASSEAGLLAQGIVGRDLEVVIAGGVMPLEGVAGARGAYVTEGGRSALVLQATGDATWAINEVDLTGVIEPVLIASGSGAPRCLAADPQGEILFVGTDQHVFRVKRFTGEVSSPLSHDLTIGPRALAALGDDAVLATGEDKLRRLDFGSAATTPNVTLLRGLAQPWGIVSDPVNASKIYLAESSAENGTESPGRVIAVNLERLVVESLVAEVAPADVVELGGAPFPNVKALAIDFDGSRLLAVTTRNGVDQLRSLLLRNPLDLDFQQVTGADPFVAVETTLTDGTSSIATKTHGIRVVTPWTATSIGVFGVAAKRLPIQSYEPTRQIVTVEGNLPMSEEGTALLWRIQSQSKGTMAPKGGRPLKFIWNTSALPDPAGFEVRAIAADDFGVSAIGTSAPRNFRTTWDMSFINTTTAAFKSVISVDVDGDGDLDLVAADYDFDAVKVFYQVRGGFSPSESVVIGHPDMDGPHCVTAADLDGDGDLDLVTANERSNNLTVHLQGPSFFSSGQTLSSSDLAGPLSVVCGDVNGDGAVDLVSSNFSSNSLTIFYQGLPGTFSSATNLVGLDGQMLQPQAVDLVDLDLDGDLDIISANRGSDNATIFLQANVGFHATELSFPIGAESPLSVDAADLNGDGSPDLAFANTDSDNVALFFNDGSGALSFGALLPAGDAPREVAAVDLDADGDSDLVTVNEGSGDLRLLFQTSPGGFVNSGFRLPTATAPSQPQSFTADDLNGDGSVDFVIADYASSGVITLYVQSSQGQFDQFFGASLVTSDLDEGAPISSAVADLDGDGDMDIVAANSVSNNLDLFFQGAPGEFNDVATIQIGDQPESVIAADLDGDGDLDLVSACSGSGEVVVAFQVAQGSFDPIASFPVPAANVVAAVDLDGDGDLDLAVGREGLITLLYQTLPGSFTQEGQVLLPPETSVSGLEAVDFDRDGDADLVAAISNGSILLLRQEAQSGFEVSQTLECKSFDPSISVVDLDGDGDVDIAAVESQGLMTLFIQGEKQFDRMQEFFFAGAGPHSLCAADLDGDERTDLVVTHSGSDDFSIFYQFAPGRFALGLRGVVGNGSSPEAIVALDIDGDGDRDLLSSNSGSDDVRIFYNGD